MMMHLTVDNIDVPRFDIYRAVYDALPNLATKHKIYECSNSCRALEGAERTR